MNRIRAAVAAALLVAAGCGTQADAEPDAEESPSSWIYQLTGYPDDGLDHLHYTPFDAAVIDLARDGGEDHFTAEEIGELRESGKTVYAYFSMGTIETYRPEYPAVADTDMVLNNWGDWPDEYFVTYWDERWWDLAVRPRLDQALAAGFDGVYLDVPNAYEEIDLELVPGEDRESLASKMVDLIATIDDYAAAEREAFAILPQNSPELREFPGYMESIDGIGIEDLFYLGTNEPCDADWCGENLGHAQAIADAGKLVLSVDYTADPDERAEVCERAAESGFVGAAAHIDLAEVFAPCE